MGEGLLSPRNHANFHLRGFKNVALRPPKSQKNSNFWYKFAPKKKSRGSIDKLEYRCTTKNLCNGTIIVLKFTLLHSVSVTTNFVIPKRDKKTNKKTNKKISHFFVYSRRATHDPHYTWHGDRGVNPDGQIYGQNSKFWQLWGAVFPHFCRDKREIWHVEADLRSPVPNFTFIGATCRPCGAKNPFLDHWVKTMPAWVRYAQACR